MTVQNFIGGAHRDAASGATTDLVDPTTGEVYCNAPLSGSEDVAAATSAAAEAFDGWRSVTPSERQRALLRMPGA